MQPENPYNQTPSGIDYLNQIAPPPPAQGFDKKTKIILTIFAIVGIFGLFFIFTSMMKPNVSMPTKMIARLQKIQIVSETFKNKLHSGTIQDINSSMVAVLTTATKSVEQIASTYKIDLKKDAKKITAGDPPDKLIEKLQDSYLNGGLDMSYAREMSFQLQELFDMMQRVNKTNRSKTIGDFLEKTMTDLSPIQKRLAVFSGTEQ